MEHGGRHKNFWHCLRHRTQDFRSRGNIRPPPGSFAAAAGLPSQSQELKTPTMGDEEWKPVTDKRSEVWKHLLAKVVHDKKLVKCMHCGKEFKDVGSTSSFT